MAYFIPRSKPEKPKQKQKVERTVRSVSRSETVVVALPNPRKMTSSELEEIARQRNVSLRQPNHCSHDEWTVVVYDPATNTYGQWGDDASGKGSFATSEEAERVAQDARRKLGPQYNVLVNPPGR